MMIKKILSKIMAVSIVASALTSLAMTQVLAETAPYPPSPVISSLTWADKSTIVRKAAGSDNWPLTWANDNHLYGGFGDGWGFKPKVPSKLGLGFARIEGDANNFSGFNIRSNTGEQTGQGGAGKKASGMLMVDGVLYMLVRNANLKGEHCQLAYSTDNAVTWTWSDLTFTEFGYCVFLNYGKNYANARDEFVYIYSHDNPSAYRASDRMILMRVPKNDIANRSAYEFFKNLDGAGDPVWVTDVDQRGAVFSHTSSTGEPRIARSGISYNAPIGRYLWWQQIYKHTIDTRFSGGFGVYDAPEPWGPWTTVYYTENWDVGPGDAANFPTKWMSEDGKTLHLVFAGDDAFSVRQAVLGITGSLARPLPPADLRVE